MDKERHASFGVLLEGVVRVLLLEEAHEGVVKTLAQQLVHVTIRIGWVPDGLSGRWVSGCLVVKVIWVGGACEWVGFCG